MDKIVDVEGGQLHARLEGAGDALVVLVHELGGSLASWDDVVPYIAGKARVLRYDMRGFGLSSAAGPDLFIELAVADLIAVIATAGPASRLILVGNAVGAAVVVGYLLRNPLERCAAILISPALGVMPERRVTVLEAADRLAIGGMACIIDAELDRSYPSALRLRSPRRFSDYRDIFARTDARSFAAYLRMLADLHLADELYRIAHPMLVLSGTLDPNRPPSEGRMLASRAADARYEEVLSGHFMAYQTPDLFIAAATPFLDQHLLV